jgi:predicted anti-sigma-YlaC factor YlaD
MTCQEAIAKLGEYLDAELTVLQQIDAHLEICAPCRAYLATYRKTTELVARLRRVDLPQDVAMRLRAFLVDHMANPETDRRSTAGSWIGLTWSNGGRHDA